MPKFLVRASREATAEIPEIRLCEFEVEEAGPETVKTQIASAFSVLPGVNLAVLSETRERNWRDRRQFIVIHTMENPKNSLLGITMYEVDARVARAHLMWAFRTKTGIGFRIHSSKQAWRLGERPLSSHVS